MKNVLDTELMDARKTAFLEAYARTGVIGDGCRAAGVSRSTYKRWRYGSKATGEEPDEEFDRACQDALDCAVDDAELELRRRAVEGVEEVMTYRGEPVWRRDPATGEVLLDDDFNPIPFTISRRSDKLLEVYVKAHRAQYRDKGSLELGGMGGGPIEQAVTVRYVLPDGRSMEDYEQPALEG
ncbi:hypothetical protein ELZ19_06790 [Brucella abortus]|uniref:hypothetical protein n=1 Tax=Brucella abortus TaxID=235 RepID=UPI0004E8B738|nr:hypothetical protein [Brucella abortus]KFH18415.1 hypothetical protein IB60_17035 [Brucella abortus LMN1]RUQ67356.1 hypothetical protein ELZ23_15625 [Brucella abortus]RUQ78347.1 hypothetical protein ELZ22_17150 [Brucella abortus]RUQ88257.1 hypothetical protein ELZ18_15455 [Brucella abortus]RUQ90286.1 hypothetical protein ELZ20_15450 [Brucella abortus]